MSKQSLNLGIVGEKLARNLLLGKGYRLIEENFRTKFGEIDLVFLDGTDLVFVEVKTRTKTIQGWPEEAVNAKKLHKIKQLAEFFMMSHDSLPQRGRIEVVAVDVTTEPPELKHYEDVM